MPKVNRIMSNKMTGRIRLYTVRTLDGRRLNNYTLKELTGIAYSYSLTDAEFQHVADMKIGEALSKPVNILRVR